MGDKAETLPGNSKTLGEFIAKGQDAVHKNRSIVGSFTEDVGICLLINTYIKGLAQVEKCLGV